MDQDTKPRTTKTIETSMPNLKIENLPEEIQRYIDLELDRLQGWMSAAKVTAIANTIIEIEAKNVVEIGVFAGRATVGIGLALKHLGDSGRCLAIDPWSADASVEGWNDENAEYWQKVNYEAVMKGAQRQLRLRGIDGLVKLHRSTSDNAVDEVKSQFSDGLDVLILDGNHSPKQSCKDVENYKPLVRPGGFIFFDDSDWEQTQDAVDMMFEGTTSIGLADSMACFQVNQK